MQYLNNKKDRVIEISNIIIKPNSIVIVKQRKTP